MQGTRRNRSIIALAVAAAVYGVCRVSPTALAQNTELDVLNGATDLTNPASYTQNLAPTVTSDLAFPSGSYSPAVFTINGNTTLNTGTLNALSATPLTITNSTVSTTATLTLNGGSNSIAGAQSGDLMYVASGGSLTVGQPYSSAGGTGTLNLTLASGGNFDIAGTATIDAGVTGNGSGFTKSGAGVLVVNGAMTNTGAVTISSGTIRLGSNSPSYASGSYLVLDANSGVTKSGTTVTGWTDLSGNGHNASSKTGTVTLGTLSNGSAALVFNGSSYLQDTTSSASLNNLTLFAVIQPTSATATGAIVGANTAGNGGIEFRTTGGTLDVLNQGVADFGSSSAVLTTSPEVVGLTFTSGSQNFYLNGASAGSTSISGTFSGSRTLQIGGSDQGEQFNGKISAIVEYNSVLNADQIAQIQQKLSNEFLGTSYGTVGSLSSSSPVSITSSGAALDLNGLGQSISSLAGVSGSNLYLGGATLTLGSDNTSTTFAGSISDTGGASAGTGGALIKTGSGTFTLSNVNTYSGATSVNAGALTVASGGSIASTAVNIASGALLALGGANPLSATAVVTDNGSFNISGPSATVPTLNGTGTLYVSPGSSLTVNAGTLSGNVNLGSGGTLTKSSAGVLLLSGTNTFSGATIISAGTLELGTPGFTLGTGATFTANSTGTLYFLAGGAQLAASDINTILAKTTANSGSVIAIDTNAGSLTYSNNLPAGAYGFTKAGLNALTLSGSNTYTGPTAITGGQLFVASANAIPTASTLTLFNNTIVDLAPASGTLNSFPVAITSASAITQIQSNVPTSGPGVNYTLGNVTSVAGTFNIASGANVVGGSPSITVGSVSLNSPTAAALTVFNPNTASLTIGSITGTAGTTHSVTLNGAGVGAVTGPITDGTGALTLLKNGPSIWTLNGTNTYTGPTTVATGKLVLTGQINNTQYLYIGGTTLNVAAAFYQSGANTNLTTTSTSTATAIATITGGQGYYSLAGGTLNTAAELDVSGAGASTNTFGEFDINGGTVNLGATSATSTLTVNRSSVAGTAGVLNIFGGGVVQIAGGATPADTVTNGLGADWGNDVSTISIGSIGAVTTSGTLSIPSLTVKLNHGFSGSNANGTAGSVSTLNLNGGGILQTLGFLSPVAANNANVAVNFNGGTLKAGTAANTTFLQNLGGVYIYGGGATIDDNGQNITIAQPLLAPTGSGVTSITVGTAGSGYITPPKVTITGVTGATGYATINQTTGAVTGIVITNPGFGAGTPAVTLTTASSGFTGTAASGFTINTAADVSGGLTKAGIGTLTLTGSSTFTGTTSITAGTLALDHSGSNLGSLASPMLVGSNGAFLVKGNTSIGSLTTAGGGSALNLSDGAVNTLSVNGNLSIAGGSSLSFDVLGSATDQVSATGTALVSGTSTVNIVGSAIASGNYVLLNTSGGVNAHGAGFSVGTHPAGRFNSFSFNNSTSTQEILTVSATAFATTDYWTGAASRTAGDTAYNWSTGTTSSNFSVNAAGTTDQNQIPGPVTDVIFTAANATPSSGSTLTTQLDNSFSINGLIFAVPITSGQITSTVVNLNGKTLTLGGDGLTLASTSLSSATVGTGSLVIGTTSQSWANNNSTMALTVNSNISSGTAGTTLTLNGTGNGGLILGGTISDGAGPLALSISQPNTVLGGSNAYSGGTTITGGSVKLGSTTALGTAAIEIDGGQLDLGGYSPTLPALNGSGGAVTNTGAPATLTLNGGSYSGNIHDGTGQIALTINTPGTLTLSGTNTYSGTTTVSGGTLQQGSATAMGSGVLSVGAPATVDLNGYPASVNGLIGSGTITNNGGSASTLTVHQPVGTSTFSGQVKDQNAPVALSFTGSGNQVLSGLNSYSAGTTITTGTVTAATNSALGTGTVTLNGGTLSLAYPTGSGGLVPFINGLSTSAFQVNTNGTGSNGISGSTLSLTDASQGGETTSAFTNTPLPIGNGFTASFAYTVTSRDAAGGGLHYPADGMTFTLQNAGASAIGAGANLMGYGGISNSAAVVTNIYPLTTGGAGTAFASGGTAPSTYSSIDSDLAGLEFDASPVTFNITISYNASAQSLTETMSSPAGTFSHIFTSVNLSSLVGGSTAYVGFTGSSGGDQAGQTISNFSFSGIASGPTSLANNVVATPSTNSVIALSVSSALSYGGIGTLTIGTGAKVSVTATSLDSIATRGVLNTTGLSIAGSAGAWTGKLDLDNNSLVVHGGDLPTITDQVKQGYANGTWQGSGGIVSTAAATDATHLTALGVIRNDNGSGSPFYGSGFTIAPTFGGATPQDGDILIKYTYYGDANLDGKVDGSDYSLIDNSFGSELSGGPAVSGWFNGDFNYDGVVDGSDYTLMDNAFNTQGVSLTASVAAQIGGGGSAVPEPTLAGVLGFGAVGLLGRRRRTSRQK